MTDGDGATTARRSEPPRRRQQEILEAATWVFHEKGYESTSMQDIAESVGILKGSLYYYISSKQELLSTILKTVHDEALGNIERTRAVEGNALHKIRAFITFHLIFNAENLVKMGVFFQDFRSLDADRREEIVKERDDYGRFLRGLIEKGQEEGTVCPDIDAKLAALGLLGMTNWVYHWYQPGGPRSAAEVAEAYADLAVAALACDPATHEPGHRGQVAAFAPGYLAERYAQEHSPEGGPGEPAAAAAALGGADGAR